MPLGIPNEPAHCPEGYSNQTQADEVFSVHLGCLSGESRNPTMPQKSWMRTFTGMTAMATYPGNPTYWPVEARQLQMPVHRTDK